MAAIFSSRSPFLNPTFTSIFFFFVILITGGSSLYFQLCGLGPGNEKDPAGSSINTYGAAYYTSQQGIHLARPDKAASSRATCVKPLHLWDKTTGQLSDFKTHFSFILEAIPEPGSDESCPAVDAGMAFFLAPIGSSIPDDSTGGGLGLVSTNKSSPGTGADKFVAVEFDPFQDAEWDAPGPHVGININSVKSVTVVPWWNNFTDGEVHEAWVSYDSNSKSLCVVFTNRGRTDSLKYVVDLRDHLPEWVEIGFSGATSGGKCFVENAVSTWSFNSTRLPSDDDRGKISTKKMLSEIIAPITGVIFGVVLLFIFWNCWKKIRNNAINHIQGGDVPENSVDIDLEFGIELGLRKFGFQQLADATENFGERLGRGGMGSVFKGKLPERIINGGIVVNSSYIAVKKITVEHRSSRELKSFEIEAKVISKLSHRNLVKLLGWCSEREFLLVYEYMRHRSLDFHLHGKGSDAVLLVWDMRYRIARELADAVYYLQVELNECVLHRDIKPGNILLDENFTCKLGDFGLARFVDYERGSRITQWAGTFGYVAPECDTLGRASKESDLYSFGVVALEIASGRRAVLTPAPGERLALVDWVRGLEQNGSLLEAADPKLNGQFDKGEMENLLKIGLRCAHPNHVHRPSIQEVRFALSSSAGTHILSGAGGILSSGWEVFRGFFRSFIAG